MAKRKNDQKRAPQDPHFKREARKYDNPIPSREFILDLLREQGVPLTYDRIAELLELDDEDRLEALRRRLIAMTRDGQLIRNRKREYCLVNQEDLITGRIIGHKDGFGFMKPDDGTADLFLSPYQMRLVMHDDRVVARVSDIDHRGRREGRIVEVLERNTTHVVGRLLEDAGVYVVVPDFKRIGKDILIPPEALNGAESGQMVSAELTEQPSKHRPPVGRIAEILGEHMAPGMETDVAIRTHGIPAEWPEEVERATKKLPDEVRKKDLKGRKDLRKIPLVTIDGADARDFDDAVHAKRTPTGWKLLVCIADVSAYVKPDAPLDEEARERGTSVYFPSRVVPMLPEKLSNGLCSINPDVDRLCMCCELLIKEDGTVRRTTFYTAVMRSHARLIYDDVAAMLIDGDKALCEQHADILPDLKELYALYKVLLAKRQQRGAIDFDTVETRFEFDDQQKVARVVPVVRNEAHRLIEECMLAANVAAANYLLKRKLPVVFRNHEGPKPEKLEALRTFLSELGITLGGGDKPQASDYAAVLEQVKDRPDHDLIQTVLLRSMSQAVYGTQNLGHFGLAFPAYTHFTSPIRRYPDLMVHRGIKHLLNGGDADDFDYPPGELALIAEHSSATERRADDATRDVSDWLKCEFMQDHLGEEFGGIISSVTSFGLFVRLDELNLEGLVHITALDNDYFHFDPVHHRLTGERGGRTYQLGDTIRVRVAAVNLDDRKIDFALAGGDATEDGEPHAEASKKKRKPRRRKPCKRD